MCPFIVDLSILCRVTLNSGACLVVACPSSFVCDQSNGCPLSSACVAE